MPENRAFKHLLVTGGCGFIGSNFVRSVLEWRPDVRITNLDVLTYSGNLENLTSIEGHPNYTFVKGDIADGDLVRSLVADCDAVVNFAAESHVDRSIQDAAPFITSNVLGTQVLLQACRNTWKNEGKAGRFLQVGTDEVYGSLPLEQPELLFTEETPLDPSSPYSASKAAADMLAMAFQRTFGMDVLVTRCSNNYGPYQFPEKVIPLFVTNLMQGEQVPLYGDGKNVRDWLHVVDHCEAILAVLEGGRAGEVYNIGGNNERSNLELTHAILDIMGMGKEMIRPVADRLGHDRRYAIDASKMKAELGWQPTRSAWPKGLEDTIQWYQDNAQWWQRVRSGAYRDYYEKMYGAAST
ncbi:MAG: dTDP-glucose 4,6-dehydratase [Phycisphaerales bacterium JB064]